MSSKKQAENINQKIALVIKSGKYSFGKFSSTYGGTQATNKLLDFWEMDKHNSLLSLAIRQDLDKRNLNTSRCCPSAKSIIMKEPTTN